MIDPDEMVEYQGIMMRVADIPDDFERRMAGIGHGTAWLCQVAPVDREFKFTPDTCLNTDTVTEGNEWVIGTDGLEYLICTYCGVDGT